MNINRDFIRRELGEIGRQHDSAMSLQAPALEQLVDDDSLTAGQKDDFVTGGLNRRRFLHFGGLAIATSAIAAACGSSSKTSTPTTLGTSSTSTGSGGGASSSGGSATDITILRTASSLEALAVYTYQQAIKSGLVTDKTVAAVATDFMNQHMQHEQAFAAATTTAGGQAYTQPNPVVLQQVVTPALAKVKNQTDVLMLAYTLESAASQTYQSTVGAFSKNSYNQTVMAVGGVESRHVALLGLVLSNPSYPAFPASGFQSDSGAVKAGTGVS
jgi:phosphoribosyl-AMP cyclohydrolase